MTAEGAVAQARAEYTVNNPPTAPVVGVDTTQVGSRGTVTATMLAPAEDLDGDPLTYSYKWRRAGVASSGAACPAARLAPPPRWT